MAISGNDRGGESLLFFGLRAANLTRLKIGVLYLAHHQIGIIMKLVKNKDGEAVTDSKKVAETFGKSHRHVLRDIEKLISETGVFGESNFGRSCYTSKQNKELACYEMTKDGFTLLAMGYGTSKALQFKIKYIKQFNEMEELIREGGSLMDKLNKAVLDMEVDKVEASKSGKTLSLWRGKSISHKLKIDELKTKSQLLLDLF